MALKLVGMQRVVTRRDAREIFRTCIKAQKEGPKGELARKKFEEKIETAVVTVAKRIPNARNIPEVKQSVAQELESRIKDGKINAGTGFRVKDIWWDEYTGFFGLFCGIGVGVAGFLIKGVDREASSPLRADAIGYMMMGFGGLVVLAFTEHILEMTIRSAHHILRRERRLANTAAMIMEERIEKTLLHWSCIGKAE
ncbi:MAG: hypothetical protein NTX79_03570 [Candidatus Micrarchaeota archaeon]|nr:hypothetical protein [Candidatus Micrarchaeota archaeon]